MPRRKLGKGVATLLRHGRARRCGDTTCSAGPGVSLRLGRRCHDRGRRGRRAAACGPETAEPPAAVRALRPVRLMVSGPPRAGCRFARRGHGEPGGGPSFSHRRPGGRGAGQFCRLAGGAIPPVSERPPPNTNPPAELPRVMGLRDVVLFNITAIVGLRWLTTAASQFGVAALPLWLVAMLVFFIPSALAVRELADVDPGAGGLYRWATRAFGARQGFLAGWGYWVNNLFYYPSLMVATAAIAAYIGGPRFVHLGHNPIFIPVVAVVGLWIAGALNIGG